MNRSHHLIEQAKFELALSLTPVTLAAAWLVGVAVAGLLYAHVATQALALWLVCLSAVLAWRWMHTRRRQGTDDAAALAVWRRNFLAGVIVTGVLWVWVIWQAFDVQSLSVRFAILLLCCGVLAGAVTSLAPVPPAYPWFALPPSIAVVLRACTTGETGQFVIGAAAAAFAGVMVMLAKRTGSHIDQSVRLRFANHDLLQELENTNAQLREEALRREKAQHAAEQAARAKSQFLANMSHEIRTPMNGVLGMAELLLDAPLPESQRRLAQTLHRSGEMLLGVINDVLDFSKIEAGKLELEQVEFDLRQCVEEVVDLMAVRAQAKGLELALRMPEEPHYLLVGDPVRLRQILTNLIGNAVKFTEKGEVLIEVRAPSRVRPGDETQLELLVRDTGIGIGAAQLQQIFEPFVQADGSTTRRNGGTGLGLTIVRELAHLMRGEVHVQSEPGVGSSFHVVLKLHAGRAREKDSGAAALAGVRVLVVDDNATNRDILCQQLIGWGAQPHCADSAAAALRLASQAAHHAAFDLALLDMEMPGMDGIELARALKADARTRAIKLCMLTSLGAHGEAASARAAGIALYLSKPVRRADLLSAVSQLCAGSDAPPPVKRAIAAPAPRVLVVEDNLVNQQVAMAMLEQLGYAAQLAHDGEQALRMLATQDFDVVLMDCLMPGLDGFETTQRIRAAQPSSGRRVPIIAVTASAFAEVRERCLQVGMDDYLSKPYSRDSLKQTLERWLVQAPRGAVSAAGASATQRATLNRRALAAIGELDPQGGKKLLAQVARLYLEEAPALLGNMRAAVAAHDAEAARRAAHSMKSSSAHLGADALADLCRELEKFARNGDLAQFEPLLAEVQDEFEGVAEQLSEEALA